MNLKVKDIDISSGGVLVAVLNEEDALRLDLHHGDRIGIVKGNRHAHVLIDIAESETAVPKGSIGLFEEVLDILKARDGSSVKVVLEEKPLSVKYIKEKLNGKVLNKNQMLEIMEDLVDGKLSDVELSYFVAGSYIHELSTQEVVDLTNAMIKTGEELKFSKKIVVDKHSTGGVAGNRTTLLIVPIIAASGLVIPKTSSRAITSPAGTADTMEVLANVDFSISKMKSIVNRTNGCIVWGGAVNLAPADDKIIQVEQPLGIDAEGQMLASILAKKGSVGSTHVLIDIPVGKETKIKNKGRALRLKKRFIVIGRKLGMKIEVIITNGNEPIGNGIGPALEAIDILRVLERSDTRPLDLEKKAVMMAGKILEMVNKCKKGEGSKIASEILDSGKALKKMNEIIKAQGGKVVNSADIPVGKYVYNYLSGKNGRVKNLDNKKISRVAKFAGAPLDKEAGVYLYVHEGDIVKTGDKIITVHAKSKEKLEFAKKVLFKGAVVVA